MIHAAIRTLAVTVAATSTLNAIPGTAEDFYAGKNVSVHIGYGTGGGYDSYGRLLARHMGNHLPGNPTLVPRNMPGAGSMKLANYLYNVAQKDGTEFGIIGNGVVLEPLLGGEGAQFDAIRFKWIGSLDQFTEIGVVWHTAKAQSLEDVMETEMVVGATGSKSGTNLFPILLNGMLGTKFKIIRGFEGTNQMILAVERGELDGFLGWCTSCVLATRPDWIEENKARLFVQTALRKDERFPDAPMVMDYLKTEEDRQIMRLFLSGAGMARPFVAPPDLPAERVHMLRNAFNAMARDPDLLAEAQKLRLDIDLVTGEDVEALVKENYATPKPVIDKAAAIFNQE